MKRRVIVFLTIMMIPFLILILDHYILNEDVHTDSLYDTSQEWNYICKHQQDYPISLLKLAFKNKETISFVYHYSFQSEQADDVCSQYDLNDEDIPLLLQWDQRWGYQKYGNDYIAVNGCGPTCLSMVTSFLKQDTKFNPYYIAQFAYQKGYYYDNKTSYELMNKGAKQLGLYVEEISLDEAKIQSCLMQKKPIIASVSQNAFHEEHYIVLRKYIDGKYYLNDSHSLLNSQQGYDFNEISSHIRKLWVYSL